ncbi:MAG: hypothetical protein JWN13_6910 [Betaproteobacteria bacterium]|jgi:hypothetical protein|nr:hypothetical protein [Betaproteobacteria bacterium]
MRQRSTENDLVLMAASVVLVLVLIEILLIT